MSNNKLLTLREIAEELGINYKTLYGYKDIFEDFIPIQFEGRRIRYLPITIDLFSKIIELKDEGKPNEEIRRNLRFWRSENLKSFLSVFPSDSLSDSLSECPSDHPSDSPTGCLSGSLEFSPSGRLSGDTDKLSTEVEENEQKGSGTDNQGMIPEESLSHIKEEILETVYQKVEEQVAVKIKEKTQDLQDRTENTLLQYKAGVNGAMTQVYKAIQELQAGIETLDKRLGHLECELQNEQGERIHLQELDLEELQIKSPETDLLNNNPEKHSEEDGHTPEINLDQLKKCINNGRPNREVVKEWIKSEKLKDPAVSYGELARQLNEYGIPTLSGRDTWCRTVVRSLAIKGNNNGEGSDNESR